MPRLQLVIDRADIDGTVGNYGQYLNAATGSKYMKINRDIHTKKVVLKGYSVHTASAHAVSRTDAYISLTIPWLTTGFYNETTAFYSNNKQALKLPVRFGDITTVTHKFRSTIVNNLNWEFHVPGDHIPSSFPIHVGCANDKRWGFESGTGNFRLTLYFEFEERLEGI